MGGKGITPKRRVEAEPIEKLQKVVEPVGQRDKAGNPINPTEKEQFTPLGLVSEHGVAATADTDILGSDITPTNTPCLLRIMVMLETTGVFSAMLTKGAVTKKLILNGGTGLSANCAYIFDILAHDGDTVNFQTDTSGNVTLRVQEIAGGVQ